MSFLKFDNVTGTTADIKLSDVVRFAIRNGYIDLGASASADAPDTAIATREDIKFSSGHMFQIIEHNGPLETIPQGTIPASGQKVYEYLYPKQYAKIIAGHQFAVTEVLWNSGISGNADAYKGCWSLGGEDEYGKWVRAPKLNADTGYRAPFLRGSQIGIDAGKTTDDRIRDIVGHIMGGSDNASNWQTNYPLGAFKVASGDIGTQVAAGTVNAREDLYRFAASNVVPTGPENSPRYHGVIMCIRMFGTVSNPGSLDAAQLATDLAVANSRIQSLEARGQLTLSSNAVLTGIDNKLVLTNGVAGLGLENGDVIRVIAGVYSKLHTVESIPNSNELIVNYEHCGGRGNGSLKLPDYTGPVTITRIAKWHSCDSKLGRDYVDVTTLRARNTNYQNSTGRSYSVYYSTIGVSNATMTIYVDGLIVMNYTVGHGQSGGVSISDAGSFDVGINATYNITFPLALTIVKEFR